MDPIHPILPTAPNIPSVAPPSGVTPTQRQIERQRLNDEREQRRRRQKQQQSRARYEDPGEHASDDDAGEDDGRPHIDVTV